MFFKHLKRLNFLLIAVILVVIGTGNIVIGSHKLENTIHDLSRLQSDVVSNIGDLSSDSGLSEQKQDDGSAPEREDERATERERGESGTRADLRTDVRTEIKTQPRSADRQKLVGSSSTLPLAKEETGRSATQQALRRLEELNRRVSYNRTVIFVGKSFILLGILAAISSLLSLGRGPNPSSPRN